MLVALDRWRARLAAAIADEVKAQRILERALFLRICEARGVVSPGTLRGLAPRGIDGVRGWFEAAANRWDCGALRFECEGEGEVSGILGEVAEAGFGDAPTEVIGQVYERSLAGGARKAGGVVYTPGYIVEAIVARTVEAMDRRPLRILDPACGAGAFLLGAYRHVARGESGARRVQLLRDCVHGVDIDARAVEVARLSLLLEVLTVGDVPRALPDLERTIRRGDALREEGTEKFDVVVGNPPYVRSQRIGHDESDYLFKRYKTLTSKADLSLAFLEMSLGLVAPDGVVGMICTSQWLTTDYGRELRRLLAGGLVREIVDFASLRVFNNVSTYPAIVILSPQKGAEMVVRRLSEPRDLSRAGIEAAPVIRVRFSTLSAAPWQLGGGSLTEGLDRAGLAWRPLAAFGRACIGAKSGLAAAFVVDEEAGRLEPELLVPYAYQGSEVVAYGRVVPRARIIYPYTRGADGTPVLIPEDVLRREYPRIHGHLVRWKGALRERRDSRRAYATGDEWYRYLRAGKWQYIEAEKVIIKGIARVGTAGVLGAGNAFDGANCPSVVFADRGGLDVRYFLGVLNARVLSEYFRAVCPPKQGGYVRFGASAITAAPIRVLDLGRADEREIHDRIVARVGRLLDGEREGGLVQDVEREVAALYGVGEQTEAGAAALEP